MGWALPEPMQRGKRVMVSWPHGRMPPTNYKYILSLPPSFSHIEQARSVTSLIPTQ